MLGGRRSRLLALLARQPHVHAVARRVVLDAGEVEHLRERASALLRIVSRLRPVRVRARRRARRRLPAVISSTRRDAEQRQDAPELDAVADGGAVGDVDA